MKIFTAHTVDKCRFYNRMLGAILLVSLLATSFAIAIPTYVLDLKSLSSFVVLAGSTVTGTPSIILNGNVGLSPAAGSYVAGFDGTNVTNGALYVVDASGPAGSVVAAAFLLTAKGDITIAYNDAAGRTPVPTGPCLNPNGANLGGQNLVPGLYKFTSTCLITGGDVTLTGSATDVWIFQIGSNLVLGDYCKVKLAGGAQASNVFWQVGTSATLGTYSVFKGTILADQSVSLDVGATMDGRALAFSGAVTMHDGVTSTKPVVQAIFSADSLQIRFGNVANGLSKKDTVTITNIGGADLIISNVTTSNPLFTVTATSGTITPSSTRQFVVTFSPLSNGIKNGYIYFNHNGANGKDSIAVNGTSISPIFSVFPLSLNFGTINNGVIKRDSVTVTNTGLVDLIISSISSSGTFYTTTPATATITPSSTRKFYVTFAPLADGLRNGFVVFNHNAANAKDSISVTGTGISPKFSVNPLSINFGTMNNGVTKTDSVTVTNIGSANLIISNLVSSSSFFTVVSSSSTITPSGTKKFYINYLSNTDGLHNGYIVFYHNASNLKDSISVIGTGVSPVFSVNPQTLNFGSVNINYSRTDSVTVTNTGTSNLVFSSFTSSNNYFTINPTIAMIAPGATRKFYITFSPVANGAQNGYIYFNHNASNLKDSIMVGGTGVSPMFSVNPLSLGFGNVNTGISKRDSVTVTNIGTASLIISSVTSSNLLFTVTPIISTIAPGASRKFYVVFSPLARGQQDGNIYFYHNGLNGYTAISVGGNGVSPEFSVNPSSLDFGEVNNAVTKMDSVTVSNNGTTALVISSITSSNTHFIITALRATIAQGMSQKFYVTFTPLTSGVQNGYIYFNFNATNARDSIHVTGTGVGTPVFPVFSVNPLSLDFGNVNSGTTKMDSVTITNGGTANLIIHRMYSDNVFYTSIPSIALIAGGASEKIYVTFSPLVPGFQTGYLYFYHNGTNGQDSIRVTGTGIGNDISPKFECTKKLDFGTVFISTSLQKSVIVTNTGLSDLIISDVISTESHYIVTPILGTIAKGTSQEFFITFAPTVIAQVNGKIIFTHNAGKDTIEVTGRGLGSLPVITIKEARELPIGTEFSIEGIVTRTLGSYTRIQDPTGAIAIYQPLGVFFNEVENYDIQIADLIRVQGKISEMEFLKVISGNDLTGHQRLSRLNLLPTPVKVTLSELTTNGEKYESKLVTLSDLTVSSGGDISFQESKSYQTTDASDKIESVNTVVIRIGNSNDTYLDGMPFLGKSVTFLGVLSQSSTSDPAKGYQLYPVLPTDLSYVPTGVAGTDSENPYSLSDNYPNPFYSSTMIQYKIGNTEFVSLKVFNLLGKEVATLVNGIQESGTHYVTFFATNDNTSLGSSVYLYRLEVGTFVTTKRMILVK